MNTEEIKTYRQKLEEEIRHKAALLEAYKLVEADIELRDVPPPVAKIPTAPGSLAETAKPLPEVPVNGTHHNGSNGIPYGKNSRLVRNAINHMPGVYSVRTIHSWLKNHGEKIAKVQVATVLNRLKDKGEIVVSRHGSGRRPTTFRSRGQSPAETISPETGQSNGGAG